MRNEMFSHDFKFIQIDSKILPFCMCADDITFFPIENPNVSMSTFSISLQIPSLDRVKPTKVSDFYGMLQISN